ncbi:hypothetical protein DLJ49_18780 [Rhodovulum sp. 12E13]|uniref:head-tail joining protein n=1 Tax=Rhodovulum sp. 12E13 TaxID=2203891 RepID=UPI000E18AD2B|nr:hypothetical protein [Rhodovulum sp. 12E13]RDC69685.1 hypothetical protein DLJ49_18780 [Rhodovulum sp. 12E13]
MKLNTARHFSRILGRPATYTAPEGGAVSVRAKIEDADAALRMAGQMEMVTHDAVAFVAADVAPERGGEIQQDGSTYRVDGIQDAKSPGMLRLDLTRLSGSGVDRWDFSRGVRLMNTEPVEWHGHTIGAHVNNQGVHFEDQGYGVPVETVRTVVLLAVQDDPGISVGDTLTVRGEARTVVKVMRTGANTIRVVL